MKPPSFQPAKKPAIASVPLSEGLTWRGGQPYLFQEKSDGRHAFAELPVSDCRGPALVNAERMADGSLVVNDLLAIGDEDLRRASTRQRWAALNELFGGGARLLTSRPQDTAGAARRAGTLTPPFQDVKNPVGTRSTASQTGPFQDVKIGDKVELVPTIRLARTGHGGEFLEAILRDGGEGVVAKHLDAPFGVQWFKCKRLEKFYCVVTEGPCGGQSVGIGMLRDQSNIPLDSSFILHPSSFTPAGRVALFGQKCEQVRVGSILKVEGYGLTPAGKIREPRPCKDTATSWLVRW